ncbi:unnamed protein product, partial [Ectocarpus fasciculatus]
WLHTRFVNPKGRQGSAVSCLPAALEKAGVDPAQLHVLQIHIRQPPDDWGGGGGGGGGGRRKNLISFPGGSSRFDDSSSGSGPNAEQQVSDSRRHSGDAAGDVGLGIAGLGSGESGYGSATGTAAATVCAGSGEEEGAPGAMGSEGSSSSSSSSTGGGGGGGLLPPRLDSPPSSPEIFYSMKLVTGKDAVGTLSGPGTLGIERCIVKGGGDGMDGNNPAGGGGGGGGICGAVVEEKRPTLVQTLMDAFSWGGKGETG